MGPLTWSGACRSATRCTATGSDDARPRRLDARERCNPAPRSGFKQQGVSSIIPVYSVNHQPGLDLLVPAGAHPSREVIHAKLDPLRLRQANSSIYNRFSGHLEQIMRILREISSVRD